MAIDVMWLDEDSGTPARWKRAFYAMGSTVVSEIKAAVLAHADCPSTFEGLYRVADEMGIDSKCVIEGDGANSIWRVTVPYARRTVTEKELDVDECWWTIDFAYQNTRLLRSIDGSEETYTVDGKTAPNLRGFLGTRIDSGRRRPYGIDIQVSALALSGRWVKSQTAVTAAYLRSLVALANSPVNADQFVCAIAGVNTTFEPGECRLSSIQTPQSARPDGGVEFSASILLSPNIDDGSLLGFSGVDKKGWQYAEALYEDAKDPNAYVIVPDPICLKIRTVHGTSSFAPIKGV